MQSEDGSPTMVQTAWALAALGYLPFFVALVVLAMTSQESDDYPAYMGHTTLYGSIILTFLGGVRWGLAISPVARPSPLTLVASILPSVAAFVLTIIAYGSKSAVPMGILAGMFALHGIWDQSAARNGTLPGWFGKLRLVLTILVTLTLAASFVVAFNHMLHYQF